MSDVEARAHWFDLVENRVERNIPSDEDGPRKSPLRILIDMGTYMGSFDETGIRMIIGHMRKTLSGPSTILLFGALTPNIMQCLAPPRSIE